MTAARRDDQPGESDALRTALDLLARGLWPVATHKAGTRIGTNADGSPKLSEGKEPIAEKWGKVRPTPEILRAIYAANPGAGVGLKLGLDVGVIDIENDSGAEGEATLLEMMDGEQFESMGWDANRGFHLLAQADPRLAKYNKTIIKIGGLEIRLGTVNIADPKQTQSVLPPTPRKDGTPRTFNGVSEIRPLPDAFFRYLDRAFAARTELLPRQTIPIYTPKPGEWTAEDRAAAYLSKVEPAIAGQGGHDKAIYTAVKIGPGFDLDPAAARRLLAEWSRHCKPPWSDRELDHKVAEAYKIEPRRGWLLGDNNSLGSSGKSGIVGKSRDEGGQGGTFDHNATFATCSVEKEEPFEWEPPRLYQKPPVVPFPLEVFPVPLAELCRSIAKSMSCPVDYPAGFALALAGAAMGMSVNLKVKEGWVEAPNLFLAVVGYSGTKKSPPLRALARVLNEIDRKLLDDYEVDRAIWEQQDRDAKAAKAPSPPPPVLKQVVIDDATREAVVQIHSRNRRGLALVNDELMGWVMSLDAYRAGKGNDKQFWMSVNSGSPVKADRKGKQNEPQVIPRPCVTVVGPLTPAGLPGMKHNGADDGWIDRILFNYPDEAELQGWSEEGVAPGPMAEWEAAIRRLWARPMIQDETRLSPAVVGFTAEAKAVWVEWFNSHVAERKHPEFPRSLGGPWSKMEGFVARFALILSQLAAAYHAAGDLGKPSDVAAPAVLGARLLAGYFKAGFRRAKWELSGRPMSPNDCAESLLRWLRDRLAASEPRFTGRDVSKRFFRFDHAEQEDALRWLCSHNVVRQLPGDPRKPGEMGRPRSPVYEINPFLEQVAKAAEVAKVRDQEVE